MASQTRSLGTLQGEDFESREWGFTVKRITHQMMIENQLDDTLGVYVVGVKRVGPADVGGLNRGDVVESINRKLLESFGDFVTRYGTLSGTEDRVLLEVRRGNGRRLVVLKVDRDEGEASNE